MTVNNGSQGYEVSFLQTTLSEKFDPDTAVTGTYDLDTHKKLIQYLRYPNTSFFSDVENKLCELDIRINESNYRKFNYVFSINTDIGQLLCTQKAISYVGEVYGEYVSAKYLADSIIDTVKPEIFKLGWYLTYEINDQSKFVVTIKPISQKDSLPKSTMLSMVNLAGLDYLDGYTIKGNKIVTDEAIGYELAIWGQRGDGKSQEPIEDQYDRAKIKEFLTELFKPGELTIDISKTINFESIKKSQTQGYWEEQETKRTIKALDKIIPAYSFYGEQLQVRLIKMTNRIYFINNISHESTLNFLHSFDKSKEIHIYFCKDYLSSDKVKSGGLFDFYEEYYHRDRETGIGYLVKNGESVWIRNEIPKDAKSVAVEIEVPEKSKYQSFLYRTYMKLGAYNTELDSFRRSYLKQSKEHEYQPVKIDNVYHYMALKTYSNTPLCVDDVDVENMYLTYDDLDLLTKSTYPRQVVWRMKKQPEYLLVYESKNKYAISCQPDFTNKPYLIHDMFFDYLLDSSIHENSEEERIDMVRKLVYGEDNKYEGYTDKLKKDIQKIQKDNNIPFETGFVDTQTLYLLRGDE